MSPSAVQNTYGQLRDREEQVAMVLLSITLTEFLRREGIDSEFQNY